MSISKIDIDKWKRQVKNKRSTLFKNMRKEKSTIIDFNKPRELREILDWIHPTCRYEKQVRE